MSVVISAHTDTVFPDGLDLHLSRGRLRGTLDNIVGVFAVMRVAPKLQEMGVRIYFPRDEERLMKTETALAKRLLREPKPPVVISVDVDEFEGYDIRVDNVHGFDPQPVLDMLEWHDLRAASRPINFDDPTTADEAWAYARAGLKTCSLCIPVQGDFHTKDCTTTLQQIEKAAQAIIWTCVALLDEEAE